MFFNGRNFRGTGGTAIFDERLLQSGATSEHLRHDTGRKAKMTTSEFLNEQENAADLKSIYVEPLPESEYT